MSKLNFLIFLNTYSDSSASNNPSLSNFKWTREISGIPASNPLSNAFSLAPGESKTLFSGTRTLSGDGTTVYSLTLKPLSSNTYVLQATAGTLPNFRTPRATGADATTGLTVTVNGTIATFSSTAGTPLDMTAVQVGDFVRVGSVFNILNQGEFQILSKTATSFTVENDVASNEGPIVLTSDFANQIQMYSGAGVQKGDTLVISGGFSSVTQGSYIVTGVSANSVEFYTTDVLPQETGIMTTALAIYSAAKSIAYIESNQKVTVTINGTQNVNVEPIIINDSVSPGIFMVHSTMYSLSVQNNSTNTANLFLATVE